MELFHVILFTQPFNQSEKGDYEARTSFCKEGARIINPTASQSDSIATLLGFGVLDINLVCLLFSCLNKKVWPLFLNQRLLHSEPPPLFM